MKPKFNLLTLVLMVTTVAMFTAWWKERQRSQKERDQLIVRSRRMIHVMKEGYQELLRDVASSAELVQRIGQEFERNSMVGWAEGPYKHVLAGDYAVVTGRNRRSHNGFFVPVGTQTRPYAAEAIRRNFGSPSDAARTLLDAYHDESDEGVKKKIAREFVIALFMSDPSSRELIP